MDPKYLAGIEKLYGLGASFTPLRGKVPVLKSWAAAPREELPQALAWAKAGNVGLRTGGNSGGIVVVDVENDAEPGAYEALGLPPTLAVRTGSGGFHYYFRANGHRIKNSAGKLVPNIDVRGEGGQVVFPGSIHPDTGQPYEFINPDQDIAQIPHEFVEKYAPKILKDYKPPAPAPTPIPVATPGDHPYLRRAMEEECRSVATAVEGTRNDTLNTAAFKLGSLIGANALRRDEVEAALLTAAGQCGLGEHEARSAIRSGVEAGMRSPRALPDSVIHPQEPWQPRDEDGPTSHRDYEPVIEVPPEYLEEHVGAGPEGTEGTDDNEPPLYDVDNAVSLFLRHNRRMVMYHDILYAFNGTHYRPKTDIEVRAWLMGSITGPQNQRRQWRVQNGRSEVVQPVTPKVAMISHMFELIRNYGRISYEPNIPHWIGTRAPADNVLVVANGILDTTSLELRPHTDDLFCLVGLPYAFDPKAACPNWLRFIDEITCSDEGMACLLQELFGYCLAPGQPDQKVFIFTGEGRNGKSVCAKVLTAMLGSDNVSHTPIEGISAPHATVSMVGKLANITEEWHHIEPADEGVLKAISGGDPIHINPKHKQQFSTPLSAKMIVVTNESPSIRDKSLGMWRRLMPIPFNFKVSEDKKVPFLEKTLIEELPGILNWALEGLRSYRTQGAFTAVNSVSAKLEEYRSEVSPTWTWADDHLVIVSGTTMKHDDAYSSYFKWAKENGNSPLNSVHFAREIGRWFQHRTGADLVRNRIREGSVRQMVYEGVCFAPPEGVSVPGGGYQ